MMQLMRGFARSPTHVQLPARRRTATKDRARRLATALVGAMFLSASLSLLIRDKSQTREQALAPDSGQVPEGVSAPAPPPANGATQADAIALAHAQAVAMADTAAENAAKDPVDVDSGVRSLRREVDSDGERESIGTEQSNQTGESKIAQAAEMARAAAAARAALNDGGLDDESGEGRGVSEQQANENDDRERAQDESNEGFGSEPRRLEPEDRQRQGNGGIDSEQEDNKQLNDRTNDKSVGWLWRVRKKPRDLRKLEVGPVPQKYTEQNEGVEITRRSAARSKPYKESGGRQAGASSSEQRRDDSESNNLHGPITTGTIAAEDSGEDEDRIVAQSRLNSERVHVQTWGRNADIDTPPEAQNADTDYFAGYRSRLDFTRRTPREDDEAHERLTTRDFGVVFGMAIAHSAVVSAGDRAHLQHHDISRDSAYKRIRNTGQMIALVARYADALENAAAGGDESTLVYVGPANDVSMGYGLYAARSLPAGTVLGEYGGRYVRVLPDKVPGDYVWHLPLLNVNNTDEAWAVDAAEWGNALRFCNDLGPGTWNVAARVVPWNGRWHVIYETITPVLENEQLSVSYGRAFWARRKQVQ